LRGIFGFAEQVKLVIQVPVQVVEIDVVQGRGFKLQKLGAGLTHFAAEVTAGT